MEPHSGPARDVLPRAALLHVLSFITTHRPTAINSAVRVTLPITSSLSVSTQFYGGVQPPPVLGGLVCGAGAACCTPGTPVVRHNLLCMLTITVTVICLCHVSYQVTGVVNLLSSSPHHPLTIPSPLVT